MQFTDLLSTYSYSSSSPSCISSEYDYDSANEVPNSCSEDDWEMYERDFDPKQFKSTKIGPDYQITDPLPTGHGKDPQSSDRSGLEVEIWNPDRISTENLGKYQQLEIISGFDSDRFLMNLKALWPYHLYKYSEDQALQYLVNKKYDIATALTTLVVDIEDLIR